MPAFIRKAQLHGPFAISTGVREVLNTVSWFAILWGQLPGTSSSGLAMPCVRVGRSHSWLLPGLARLKGQRRSHVPRRNGRAQSAPAHVKPSACPEPFHVVIQLLRGFRAYGRHRPHHVLARALRVSVHPVSIRSRPAGTAQSARQISSTPFLTSSPPQLGLCCGCQQL